MRDEAAGSDPLPTFTAALPLLLSCLLTTCSQRSEQAVERLDEVTALVPGIDPRARERFNAAKGNRRAARKSGQTVDKHLSGPRPDRAPSIEDEG